MRPLILFFLFLSLRAVAQQTSDFKDYNPAKIISVFSPQTKHSVAEISYLLTGGAFRDVYEPTTGHTYGATVYSIQSFSKTYLAAKAGYTRHHRNNQQYSGMFNPTTSLITFADTVRGTQKGETYLLSGTIAHPITKRWIAGITIDYLAGNNAKDTDPRNENNINNLAIIPGLNYVIGKIELGANFSWQRSNERVSYESFGKETKNGVTFYPLWFYTTESFYDGTNAKRDYYRNTYVSAFQFQFLGKRWKIFIEPNYASGNEKIWINRAIRRSGGETTSHSFGLKNKIEYSARQFTHLFTPAFGHTKKSVYDLQQQMDKDNRIYETILRIKRSQVKSTTAGFDYILHPDKQNGAIPEKWQAIANVGYERRYTLFRIYPADFIQTLTRFAFSAGYNHRFNTPENQFECGARIRYTTGSGQQPNLSKLNEKTTFHLNKHLLTEEYNYFTSSATGASLHFKYTHSPNEFSGIRFYIGIKHDFLCSTTLPTQGNNYSLDFNTGILF